MSTDPTTFTRRSFLGAGAALAAGLGITGLAGCAPKTMAETGPEEDAPEAATEEAADWLGSAPEIAEDEIAETIEVDVLVAGAGVTGLVAAARIGELGGKAIVVEKLSVPSTFRTDIGAIDSRLQRSQNVSIDKAGVVNDIQRYATGQADGRLLKVWADESGEAMDWMLDMFDEANITYYLETDPGAEDMIYKEWPVTHGINDAAAAMEALVGKVEDAGAEIRYDCQMLRLEQDESGRVVGALCKDLKNDSYLRVSAAKGVVLATGGYATNDDMLKALCADQYESCVMKEMTPSQDGDGIKAALWIGADMDPDGFAQIFERGCVPFGPEYHGPSEDGQIWWPGSQPFLRTTLTGERFSNESTPYDFALRAIHQRHDNTWAEIFDSTWVDQIAQFKTVGCSRIIDPGTMPGWEPTMPLEAIMGMFQGYQDGGLIVSSDTIEGLAEQMGADPAVLTATVDRYNELCEKGADEDFYKESSRMLPISQPPFYAARLGGMLLSTGNGLTIDPDMRVINKEGAVIEGLFATGNDAGGTYARTYPSRVAGLTMGRNITFSSHIAKVIMEA